MWFILLLKQGAGCRAAGSIHIVIILNAFVHFLNLPFPHRILSYPSSEEDRYEYAYIRQNSSGRMGHPVGKIRDGEHNHASNCKITPLCFARLHESISQITEAIAKPVPIIPLRPV